MEKKSREHTVACIEESQKEKSVLVLFPCRMGSENVERNVYLDQEKEFRVFDKFNRGIKEFFSFKKQNNLSINVVMDIFKQSPLFGKKE